MKKILKLLTDQTLLNKAVAIQQRGTTSGDMASIVNDKHRKLKLITAVDAIKYYNGNVDYFDLLHNHKPIEALIKVAEKHIRDGTRLDLLLGVMKSYNICYEQILFESSLPREEVLDFVVNFRKVHDAFELIAMRKWYIDTAEKYNAEKKEVLSENNTLKRKFNRLIDSYNYPALEIDAKGNVLQINKAAARYFALTNNFERELFPLLDYHYLDFENFIKSYKPDNSKHIRFMNGEQFLSKLINLNPNCYIFSMIPIQDKDITAEINKKLATLTPSETVVCAYLNRGLTTTEMAQEIGVSIDTVKTHRKNIRRKLGLVDSKETIAQQLQKAMESINL